MKELVVLVSNIGGGKSTIAKRYSEFGHVVISRDMLRYSIGGGNYVFDERYEPIIWSTELTMLDDFLNLGVNIIVDEVGVSKSMRARYIHAAKIYDYKIICYVLPRLSMKESVDRRMKNPHGQYDRELWESVWTKFDKMYEEPSLDEGFDEILKGE